MSDGKINPFKSKIVIDPTKIRAAQKEADERRERAQSFNGRKLVFLKLVAGKNKIRILPAIWRQEDHPRYGDLPFVYRATWDYVIPLKKSFVALETMFPEKCSEKGIADPIALAIEKLKAEGVIQGVKDLGMMKKSQKYYCNVISRREPDSVVLYTMPSGLYLQIEPSITSWLLGDEGEEPFNVFDYENGRDLEITKTGTGLDTKYAPQFAPNSTKIATKEDILDKLVGELYDIDKLFGTFPSDAKLKEIENAATLFYKSVKDGNFGNSQEKGEGEEEESPDADAVGDVVVEASVDTGKKKVALKP